MSDLERQGERFVVLEAAGGRGAFSIDGSESFASEAAAIRAAERATIPGGAKLVVLGFRFCATIVPPNVMEPGRGSPMLPEARPALPPRPDHLRALP